MPCLQNFLAGLMLFFSAVFALATFEQAQVGKVRGSTGPIDPRITYEISFFQGPINRLGHTELTPKSP